MEKLNYLSTLVFDATEHAYIIYASSSARTFTASRQLPDRPLQLSK